MTPAGTSNELGVQNGWEENTHMVITYSKGKDQPGEYHRWMMIIGVEERTNDLPVLLYLPAYQYVLSLESHTPPPLPPSVVSVTASQRALIPHRGRARANNASNIGMTSMTGWIVRSIFTLINAHTHKHKL